MNIMYLPDRETDRVAARLRSLGGKGLVPGSLQFQKSIKFARKLYKYSVASLFRLGMQLSAVNWIERCDCGATLDELGYHSLTCKKGGSPVWSHVSVVCEWDDYYN